MLVKKRYYYIGNINNKIVLYFRTELMTGFIYSFIPNGKSCQV